MVYTKEEIIERINNKYKEIGKVGGRDFYSAYNICGNTVKKYFGGMNGLKKECNIEFLPIEKYNKSEFIDNINYKYKEIGKVSGRDFYRLYGVSWFLVKKHFDGMKGLKKECSIEFLPIKYKTHYKKKDLIQKIQEKYIKKGKIFRKYVLEQYNISYATMKRHFGSLDNMEKECNIQYKPFFHPGGASLKGKTYNEIYGEKIANEKKALLRDKRKGKHYEDFMSLTDAKKVREQKTKERKGKTFVEIFGEENAKLILKNMERKGWWIIGRNEKQILDEIENYIGLKIHRGYSVIFKSGKIRHLDGFVKEKNLNIEVDEKHHKETKYKIIDKLYEEQLKEILDCTTVRIDEQKWLKNKEYKKDVLDILDKFIRIEVGV